MKYIEAKILKLLINFFEEDYRRIDHAVDVLRHAKEITKNMDGYDIDIVIASALLHDVGIKESEDKLGYNNGKTQEEFGPPAAEKLLQVIGFPYLKIKKVKEIIGNHHSCSRYDYVELEILKKADRIVNMN